MKKTKYQKVYSKSQGTRHRMVWINSDNKKFIKSNELFIPLKFDNKLDILRVQSR